MGSCEFPPEPGWLFLLGFCFTNSGEKELSVTQKDRLILSECEKPWVWILQPSVGLTAQPGARWHVGWKKAHAR